MKKLDLGQTITILANLGVIAGIVFLGFEIRQNTRAVNSEASFGFQNQMISLYEMLLSDPLMDIYATGMADPADLDPIETAKMHTFLAAVMVSMQNIYIQVREGATDESYARGYWQLLRNMMAMPGMQEHWATRSFVLTDEFRQFVETDVMALSVTGGTAVLRGR